ncbi:MAG TPA: TIGR02265 family protein [Myxococcota bacterium]|nr:TIGR02265 family protein [Myxococcota bacterium]HRY97038.1 TIGR02265 family protein [Myxococcota bacterium]HSA23249.1 TIGR02265 family protein [Myxococcota bacterium]
MGTSAGNPRTRGTVLLARKAFVEKRFGPPAWQRVLGRLSAQDRQILEGQLLPISWYPIELNLRLDDAIAAELSPAHRDQIFLDMGWMSAEVNLKGSHAAWVRPGNPHYLLGQAPVIYRFYYSQGHRTYTQLSETSGVLRTFDAESVTRSDCLTVCGWYVRAIELCGGRQVEVRETRCRTEGAECCEYHCAWSR